MNINELSSAQLYKAANIIEKIQELNTKLASLFQGEGESSSPAPRIIRRKISAAGRARIAAAQKARWAKINKTLATAVTPKPIKKRRMSAAGRARIIAAQKARWAKAKKAKRT